MDYLVLPGGSCVTTLEVSKLIARINKNAEGPKVTAIEGFWVYYVHLNNPGSAKVSSFLEASLTHR